MSDVPTATKIAALEEHVRQLTADAAAFSSILKRGQEWMNSAHDSWQRMCNQREEAREALTKALADNATLNVAKDRLIDERNACLRELDAARQELAERNAYAERLVAENVRLSNDLAAMHTFLDKSKALCGDWQMAVMLAVPHGTVWDAANPKAMVKTITAENVRLTNEAAEVRGGLDAAKVELRETQIELEAMTEQAEQRRNRAKEAEHDLANARSWIDGQDVRSDFPTATAMRETLESLRNSIYAACAGTGCLNAHELRQALDRERERVLEWNVLVAQGCTPGGSEFHDCPQNVAHYIKERLADKDRIMKSQQKELNKERERCGVLEREVKAWHAAEHLRKDEPHNEFMRLAEARFRTRETHALDAAKFVGGG